MQKYALISFLFLFFRASEIGAEEKTLYILHTNNTNGALENCYCPDHPYGSIEKRAVFVDNFIRENPNTILVDAGDFFPVSRRTYLDSLVCEAYSELPYDALLLGDQELARTPDHLNAVLPITGAQVIGTNLRSPQLDGLVRLRRIERGGLKIAIFGVMDPEVLKYYPESVRNRIELEDPLKSVRSAISNHAGDADLIVVLTHQGEAGDRLMAREIDEIDVIIGAHSQSVVTNPTVINETYVAQAGKEGYHVGVVVVKVSELGNFSISGYVQTMTLDMPDNLRIMKLVHEYEQKTNHINRNKLKHQGKAE